MQITFCTSDNWVNFQDWFILLVYTPHSWLESNFFSSSGKTDSVQITAKLVQFLPIFHGAIGFEDKDIILSVTNGI